MANQSSGGGLSHEKIETNNFLMIVLILVAIANSLVSVYYYLRVMVKMYMAEPAPGALEATPMKVVRVRILVQPEHKPDHKPEVVTESRVSETERV